jgi:hypothetical protein
MSELANVRGALMDSSSAIWTDDDLQLAIRNALREMNLALGTAYTVDGLDGAAATSLPGALFGTLEVGAGAYAVSARMVDRAEAYELANESGSLKGWYELQRSAFEALLSKAVAGAEKTAELARLAGLRASSSPFAAWADDFGEKNL